MGLPKILHYLYSLTTSGLAKSLTPKKQANLLVYFCYLFYETNMERICTIQLKQRAKSYTKLNYQHQLVIICDFLTKYTESI